MSPKTEINSFMGVNPPRNRRYEFHSTSMIDLILTAYGTSPDRILGGLKLHHEEKPLRICAYGEQEAAAEGSR